MSVVQVTTALAGDDADAETEDWLMTGVLAQRTLPRQRIAMTKSKNGFGRKLEEASLNGQNELVFTYTDCSCGQDLPPMVTEAVVTKRLTPYGALRWSIFKKRSQVIPKRF